VILHPGILALLVGSSISLLMLIYAASIGAVILLRWDYNSSSAYQLTLERKTYLISSLVNYSFGFLICSSILFIFTMEDIHRLFVGAMCATGSFNANPVGWYILLTKITIFFLSGFWISLNSIDRESETYPLIKAKYLLLFVILPIIAADLYLQLSYFLGLDPDIITSCCGSLFGANEKSSFSTVTALPVLPSMLAFFSFAFILAAMICCAFFYQSELLRYLLLLWSALFFFLSIISIISFVSIYTYEMPMHHCPFDILQHHYGYIGYPLYITLFCGVFFSLLPGIFQSLKKNHEVKTHLIAVEKKWLILSMANLFSFTILVIYIIISSNLTLT